MMMVQKRAHVGAFGNPLIMSLTLQGRRPLTQSRHRAEEHERHLILVSPPHALHVIAVLDLTVATCRIQ